MNHELFESLLEAYVKGGLTKEENERLMAHLDTCPSCRLQLAVQKDLQSLSEGEEVPPSFQAAWRERVKESNPAPKKLPLQLTRFVALAASLMLILFGAYKAGQQDLLGLSPAPADQAVSQSAPAPMQAESMGILSDMSMDTDQTNLYKAAPDPEPRALQAPQVAPENKPQSFLMDNLNYLLAFLILVLLVLLIQEKRKQK